MTTHGIRTKPEPWCPTCGAIMVLRRPKPEQKWKPFWSCNRWPDCDGRRQIDERGEPEDDDEILNWDEE